MKPNSSILIVDDQPDNIRTLSAMLVREGYKVRKALNGETALEAAQTVAPDLILLDIMMPQMDGYEVCSALKTSAATCEIPVIFLSALSDISDKSKAFAAGGFDYITKPFQAEEVLLRVSHQLTIRRQRQELVEQNDRLQREIQERQRAEAIVQRQIQQEQLLSEIIQHIRQSLQLDQILEIAVNEIRHLLRVDQVLIFRFNPDWSSQIIAESVQSGQVSRLGQCFDSLYWKQYWQALFQQGQGDIDAGIYADNLQINYAELLADAQIRVSLSFPIPHSHTPWGIIVAHHYFTPRTWVEWEINFLYQCTAQLAIAIQHSELYHHLEEQVQQRTANLQQSLTFETLLRHITDSVRDSLDEQQILQAAVEELSNGLGVECCEACLYSADSPNSYLIYGSHGCSSFIQQVISVTTDQLHSQLLQKHLFQFTWLQPNSSQPHPVRYAVLACPIFDNQQVWGSLWLLKPGAEAFTNSEVRLVEQVRNHCAIALRQSRLYQAAQLQVRELQKLNQLKDDFLSTISHELRTPITNIKMVIHLLMIATNQQQELIDEPIAADITSQKIAQYLEILQKECEQELHLIQNLLDLQQLEAGVQPLSLVPLELDLWICNVVEPFKTRCAEQQQTLQIDLVSALLSLTTDAFCLNRILTELLTNACKYTPAGETITIEVQATTETVLISVSNSGVEIPAEAIDLVFTKFYRVPNSDPWKYGGTGLGLALVQRLVEHLNGAIEVSSGNNLTCFTVTLPLLADL